MGAWWDSPMREVFRGRKVVIAGAVPAAWTQHVTDLATAGASDLLVVAAEGRGVGTGPAVTTVVVEPPPGLAMMERIRFGNRTLESPPPSVVDALEAFDPGREAVVVGSFLNEAVTLDGRPFLGYRRPEWVRLEDKILADALWDRAGVDRLPSAVVPLDQAADTARSIDRGDGTVWAGDALVGYHGGASLTRWVVDDAAREQALTTLRPVCEQVRVMPLIDGIPCSIHGIVLPDGVAALRPVEMITLRRQHEFFYAGGATFWDPPIEVREQMREVARRVGHTLADEVDFRGTFTVDGVVDGTSFWPTELNPRFGAGINLIARATDGIPILLLNDLIVAGRSIGIDASEFERGLVEQADTHRAGSTGTVVRTAVDEPFTDRPIGYDGSTWRWADADAEPDARIDADGDFVRCRFAHEHTPIGQSAAGRAAAFWSFAADELGTDTRNLTPAPDLSAPCQPHDGSGQTGRAS